MKTYTCDCCGGTFEAGWTEADALMEYQERFSAQVRAAEEHPAQVCDDCDRKIQEWANTPEGRVVIEREFKKRLG